jgi:heterodisulfide reductase subunit A
MHPTLGKTVEIPADCVVLSTPMVANPDNTTLNKLLKVPLSQEGFFLEAHMKLRPVEFATDGIYLAGSAKWPSSVSEAVSQGYAAAAKAAAPMKRKRIKAEAITAEVDPEKCSGCGTCELVCPYKAISLKAMPDYKIAEVNAVLCKGCGTCVATCPSRAITQNGFTDQQLVSQVREAVNTELPQEEVNIIGFCCNWCSYAGADMAGVSRYQYPPNMRIIRTMCSGRVDPIWILDAFLEGADGVFVSGCHPGDCHYMTGNNYSKERILQLKELIGKYGIDPRRLRLEWVSASEGARFSELVKEFTEEIQKLGPSPLKRKGKKGGV